jgi:nucleoside-diphosphate-sugar epimerase
MMSDGTAAIIADAQRATGALAAITGPSGFIGSRVTAHLAELGYRVRALVHRHPLEPTVAGHVDGVVHGSLSDSQSLAELVRGAQVVVHIGGLIRGSSPRKFLEVNAEGTRRLAETALRENRDRPPRFILISSLTARVPDVSPYARSKRAGETMLEPASGGRLAWTALRPPAVYGPGDLETLRLARLVSFGIAPHLGTQQARFSLLHVDDLASAIAVVVKSPAAIGRTYELDDGTVGGHTWDSVFRTIGCGLGTNPAHVHVPRTVLRTAAGLIALLSRAVGHEPMLTPGKVAELTYPDWTCDNTAINRDTGWYPRTSLAQALPAIVQWAREKRLLR